MPTQIIFATETQNWTKTSCPNFGPQCPKFCPFCKISRSQYPKNL